MKFIKSLTLLLSISLSGNSFAKLIQILHTNDLHSYFQGTRNGNGGYPQLKRVIDGLKSEAAAKGIRTLYLDGGDFGEGSSFYFSNQGVDSLKALDLLGVDVTVLGNHDYLLGGSELRNQILKADLKATILSANLVGKRWMGLHRLLPDSVDFAFDELKVRIFGLTTNEIHHMYPLSPLGLIKDPLSEGIRRARKARQDQIDFTIALTHIGTVLDRELAKKTRSVDLIVGGHSHTLLPTPILEKNLNGKLIPIVQAGAHGGHVGAMLIDIRGPREADLVSYRIIDINSEMPRDQSMQEFVEKAYGNREKYFGGRKWNEVIGYSEIPLSGNVDGQDPETNTCWSRHMARITRKAGKADLGLHFDVFLGERIEKGLVTFGDIIDNFPHFRRWGDKGWKVSSSLVNGLLLKNIIELLGSSELGLTVIIDGPTVKDKSGHFRRFDPAVHAPEDVLINGEKIHPWRNYKVALPSEVPFGTMRLMNVLGLFVFQKLKTIKGASYQTLIEDYVRRNSPLRCLDD